jgi:D-galactarolactone cycloisomerase
MTPPIISSVRVHSLAAPLSRRFGWSLNWTDQRTATLVEVRTRCGLTGWGDGFCPSDRLAAHPELILGRSAFEVEAIYDQLRAPAAHQQRPGPNTFGGLDTALWDICGQALGVPVSQLLGPVHRHRVEPYSTALDRQDGPDLAHGLATEALSWQAAGFRSMKMKTGYGPDLDVQIVRAVRDAIGPATGLAVDSNCAYDSGTALALAARLRPFNLLWWEEPLLAADLAGYARLAPSGIPIAAGETGSLDSLTLDYVQPRLVDILQPEVEIIGLTGARRLSYLCWLNRIRLIPHNWGTAVRTAAILHWTATIPAITQAPLAPPVMFEFDQTESPFRDAVLTNPFRLHPDGLIPVPTAPGLGIQLIPEAVERFRANLTVIE